MFLVTNFFSVFIPFWGMLGLWTKKIGYHNKVRFIQRDDWHLLMSPSGSFISTTSSLAYFRRLIMR